MIPRAKGRFGASHGFDTRPGIVNIISDGMDMVSGGVSVDVEKISKEDYLQAAEQADDNPELAWSLAAQSQQAKTAAVTPSPQPPQQSMTEYITPQTDMSGTPAPTPTVISPTVTASPVQGVNGTVMPAVPAPAQVSSAVKPRATAKVAAAPHPATVPAATSPQLDTFPHPAPYAPAAPEFTHGQVVEIAPGQQVMYDAPNNRWVPVAPPQAQPPQAQPPQVQTPAITPAPPEATESLLLDGLGAILTQLQEMNKAVPPEDETSPGPSQWDEDDKQDANLPDPRKGVMFQEPPGASPYEEIGMGFLAVEPSRPSVAVVFRTPAGVNRTRFHHVAQRGVCLSLIYDGRYDGDQFLPNETPEGETIRVEVPSLDLESEAVVFDFHNCIGCLDVLNIMLVKPESNNGPPIVPPSVEDEIHGMLATQGRG